MVVYLQPRAGNLHVSSRKYGGLSRPQYRLRVDEVRVFYDISGSTVEILAIVAKSEAESWLAQFGKPQ